MARAERGRVPAVQTSVGEVLREVARAQPEGIAVAGPTGDLTWRGLLEQAALVAAQLRAHGVPPGAKVGLDLTNTTDHVVALVGLALAGTTPFNINYRYTDDEVGWLCERSRAAAVVTTGDRLTPDHVAMLAHTSTLALVAGPVPELGPSVVPMLGPAGQPPLDLAEVDHEWIIFTGGTTGRPKAVVFGQGRLLVGAFRNHGPRRGVDERTPLDEVATRLTAAEGDARVVTYAAPPMIHGTGLNAALGTLLVGGMVVLPAGAGYDARSVVDLLERHRVTNLPLVGDVFARPLVDELDRRAAAGEPTPDLTALRTVRSVGARFSPEVKAGLLRHCDVAVLDVIAASEGGPFAAATSTRTEPEGRFRLSPGARLLRPDGRDVDPDADEAGLLAAPARHAVRYLDEPDDAHDSFWTIEGERYVVPGDLARLRPDGTIDFVGRSARVINTGGEKVFAEEVEVALTAHPAVADACVVGVADERWGSAVGAVVSPRPGAVLDPQALDAYLVERLARYKRPRHWVVVDHVQRTETGKQSLAWARSQFPEAEPAASGSA